MESTGRLGILEEVLFHTAYRVTIFGELVPQGKGPTKVEGINEKAEYVIFDILDRGAFMNAEEVRDLCGSAGLPVVRTLETKEYKSVDDIRADIAKWKEWAAQNKREGVVGKVFLPDGSKIFFKEKQDMSSIPHEVRQKGPELQPLPESEIFGAINKARDEIGDEKFRSTAEAMPAIAKLVNAEAKKHGLAAPRNVYNYYLKFLEGLS
jgi:hypothetical protein